jgi:hypothetical protein
MTALFLKAAFPIESLWGFSYFMPETECVSCSTFSSWFWA